MILLEGTPPSLNATDIGHAMANHAGIEEVHDLHVWTVTSAFPALASHVLVGKDENCHTRRRELENLLQRKYGISHTTLQVDHVGDHQSESQPLTFTPRR